MIGFVDIHLTNIGTSDRSKYLFGHLILISWGNLHIDSPEQMFSFKSPFCNTLIQVSLFILRIYLFT